MPTVRTIGGRQVSSNVTPGSFLTNAPSPDTFGARLGEQASRIGTAVVGEIQRQERDKADSMAIMAADNGLSSWQNLALLDPENGALAQRGQDSIGVTERVLEDFDTQAGELSGGLTSDRQRANFQQSSGRRRQSVELQLRQHEFGEMSALDAETTASYLQNETSLAISNAMQPQLVGESLVNVEAAIRGEGERNGVTPEIIDNRVLSAQSAVHEGVISRLLATQHDKAARIYFEETQGQIRGESLERIEKALEEGGLRRRSQDQADQIWAEHDTTSERLKAARAIDDPAERDATVQRIGARTSEANTIDREAREKNMVDAGNLIDDPNGPGTREAIPPGMWTSFTPNEKRSLEAYAASKLTVLGEPETNWAAWTAAMDQAGLDPEAFAGRNLMLLRGSMSDTEYAGLVRTQKTIRERVPAGTSGKAAAIDNFARVREEVNLALSKRLLDTSMSDSNKNKDEVALLIGAATTAANALSGGTDKTTGTGEKASREDIQDIVDRMLDADITTPGSLWNIFENAVSFTSKPLFSRTQKALNVEYNEIPIEDREKIRADLEAEGELSSDQRVLQEYIAQQVNR